MRKPFTMPKTIVMVLLLGIIFSCGSTTTVSTPHPDPTISKTPFETLIKSSNSGIASSKIHVFKEPVLLESFFTQINKNRMPKYPIPTIDFDKEMIIAVNMGQKNTGGYAVSITSIKETQNQLEVIVEERSPAPSDIVTQALTEPIVIIKTPTTDKDIVFKKQS